MFLTGESQRGTKIKKRKVLSVVFGTGEVGLEAVHGGKTVNEIAQQYGVHSVMVVQRKKEVTMLANTLFEALVHFNVKGDSLLTPIRLCCNFFD